MDHQRNTLIVVNGNGKSRSPQTFRREVSCAAALWRDTAMTGPAGRWESDFGGEEAESILYALALAVEQRDRQTAGHCERLAWVAVALGTAMGLDRSSLVALYRGGYLHDVGKVGIPDCILFKPDALTAEEWLIMRAHTVRGEEICRPMKALAPVLPIIRHHHERWDGSGYPDGLRGQQIPITARVLQMADIYDALTSARPYKPAFSEAKALKIIEQETEKGWRDPELTQLFFRVHHDTIARMPGAIGELPDSLANLRQRVSGD
jgi:putative two-component system response regulator